MTTRKLIQRDDSVSPRRFSSIEAKDASSGEADALKVVLTGSDGKIDETFLPAGANGETAWASVTGKPESYPPSPHNHDDAYSTTNHNHDGTYALSGHDHAGVYAPIGHNHDGSYASTATFTSGAAGLVPASGGGTTNFLRADGSFAAPTAAATDTTPKIQIPVGFLAANLTAVKTLTSNSSFAVYIGRAGAAYTSLDLRYRVTTAAATITWAEVGIFSGTPVTGGNPTLTRRGTTDVAAVINSTGLKTTTIACSGITVGMDLWAVFGCQATTAAIIRGGLADDLQTGVQAALAATRPSTVGAVAWTLEGATVVSPWCALIHA